MNEFRKLDVLTSNKGLAERFSDLITIPNIAFLQFRANLAPNWNPFS